MYSAPKHRAARNRSSLRNRLVGFAFVASATAVTGVAMTPPAEAAVGVWDRVAACESGGNWAINSGNGYFGGLQFSQSTWRGFGGLRYAPTASRASKAVQVAIAQRVLAAQGPGAWPVCGRKAGLTRANGGAATSAAVSRSRARVAISANLVVDGRMGPRTIRLMQRWVGTAQNGNFGPTTVRALQRRVGVPANGVLGARTIRALQIKINARRDGARRLNVATIKALQMYLNRHY
jgi:hypothetical protein